MTKNRNTRNNNDMFNPTTPLTPDGIPPPETSTPIPSLPPAMTHKQMAELWDIVIRAHYLAHELGDACASSSLASARMALSLSEVLSCWARMFGEELEALEKRETTEKT